MAASYMVDANLLVLLVVGMADRRLIGRHRRVKHFGANDFDRLRAMLDQADRVFVTPNTLTETSNLLNIGRGPERERVFDALQYLIEHSIEVVVPSVDAARREEFNRLGLTDSALLESISAERPLLTVDVELFRAAWTAKPFSAINFNVQESIE